MTIMNWDSSLDIGVDSMNQDHQKILNLMNQLHDEYESQVTPETMLGTLKDLAKVTIEHFEREEEFMRSIDFESLQVHQAIHKDLLNKLTGFLGPIESGEAQVDDKLFSFLKLWLSAHIKGVDAKYGEASKKKAA